jgi:hypothetical protein
MKKTYDQRSVCGPLAWGKSHFTASIMLNTCTSKRVDQGLVIPKIYLLRTIQHIRNKVLRREWTSAAKLGGKLSINPSCRHMDCLSRFNFITIEKKENECVNSWTYPQYVWAMRDEMDFIHGDLCGDWALRWW